ISFGGFIFVIVTLAANLVSHSANIKRLLASEDAHKLAERAILSIDLNVVTYDPDMWSPHLAYLEANFKVKNSGKTPALNIASTIQVYSDDVGNIEMSPSDTNQTLRVPKVGIINSPMEAGGEEVSIKIPVEIETWNKLQSHAHYGFIYGKVTYDDVFGTSHFFNFGFYLVSADV